MIPTHKTSTFVHEFLSVPEVATALTAIHDWPHVLLLESSLRREPLGRYSFLTADPVAVFELSQDGSQPPFAEIQAYLQRYQIERIPDLPPFQGGAAGMLSYELGHHFEQLPKPAWNPTQLPRFWIGIYGWVIAWDHVTQRCWYIGHGNPDDSADLQQNRIQKRFEEVSQKLNSSRSPVQTQTPVDEQILGEVEFSADFPIHPVESFAGVFSNFKHDDYLTAVQQVIDHIYAGDLFQANLSQQLFCRTSRSPLEHYLELREQNPAPFASYLSHPDWAVLSSSPERYMQVQDGVVLTRPIKGTRRRQAQPEADLYTRDELRESEKDRSENVMIVDLMRNDLSRVCEPGSIRVPELCQIETYETVTHLVSEVTGRLRHGLTFWDLIAATFPGGSITGAPKIKAMEIISQIERCTRGAYCGSFFYLGFDGTADSSILIRTMTQRDHWLTFPVGGGVVAMSTPELEYQETLHKALGMLQSLKII